MVDVKLWAGLQPSADNQKMVGIKAHSIREKLRELEELYLAPADPIRGQVAVAVDGII